MAMWRCPHCSTPQAETARCWVCHRSTTACGTCKHFRRSVAAQLGYCGLDRKRRPLGGREIRACWEWPGPAVSSMSGPMRDDGGTPVRKLEFVEVPPADPATRSVSGATPQDPAAARRGERVHPEAILPPGMPPGAPMEGRWSLWGDPET